MIFLNLKNSILEVVHFLKQAVFHWKVFTIEYLLIDLPSLKTFITLGFGGTTTLTLSSKIQTKYNNFVDLPNLSTFTTGSYSFRETTSLTLSSIFYLMFI